MNWILYCSHNSLPLELEEFFQEQLEEAADSLPICSCIKKVRSNKVGNFGQLRQVCKDNIYAKNNWDSYLAQMKAGALAIANEDKDANICIAEHDVLYGKGYFKQIPSTKNTIIKNTNLYFLNSSGFYGPHGTGIHSQTIMNVNLFLHCLNENVPNTLKFKNIKEGNYTHDLIKFPTPSIDVRWGGNYTGPKGSIRRGPVEALPIWGHYSSHWAEITKRNSTRFNNITSSRRWSIV
jgi:hypothetical protein